jgi:hypothetical protein
MPRGPRAGRQQRTLLAKLHLHLLGPLAAGRDRRVGLCNAALELTEHALQQRERHGDDLRGDVGGGGTVGIGGTGGGDIGGAPADGLTQQRAGGAQALGKRIGGRGR